ncbi:hypothetical protein FACS1894202_00260 [Clostridia bacterium]|nr:hypothetical protein FACS1894202_00260 [Clostridia bacterium]
MPENEKKKRKLPRFVIPLLVLAGILGGGALWQMWMLSADSPVYDAPGYVVHDLPLDYASPSTLKPDKNAYIHVYTTGTAGAVSVLMLSDWDTVAPALDYAPIIRLVAPRARVIVVERPGHGWSGAKYSERTVDNMVNDTLFALNAVAEAGPFVIVADGTSGLEAIHMASKYPEMVSGIMFINAPPPAVYVYNPSMLLDILKAHTYFVPRVTGIFRAVNAFKPAFFEPGPGVDPDWYRALYFRNAMSSGMRAEIRALVGNAKDTLVEAAYLNLPCAAFVYNADYEKNPEVTRVWDDFNASVGAVASISSLGSNLQQLASGEIAQSILSLVK